MTVEQRIEALERELETLRGKPVVYASSVYAVANQNCKAHFEAVKLEGQNYGGQMKCEELARQAFKEKYKVSGKNNTPKRYIDTEDKAAEYVGLFKEFLDVYQRYLQQ